jgi:hypothetical protein
MQQKRYVVIALVLEYILVIIGTSPTDGSTICTVGCHVGLGLSVFRSLGIVLFI